MCNKNPSDTPYNHCISTKSNNLSPYEYRTQVAIFFTCRLLSICLESSQHRCLLSLLHKLRFQLHRSKAIDFAINIMIPVDQANVFDLGADLHDR